MSTKDCVRTSLLCLGLLLTALPMALAAQTLPTTLIATNDTCASSYEPSRNFGGDNLLVAITPNDQVSYEAFVRFDMSKLSGITLSKVTLHLYALRQNGVNQLYLLDDSADNWSEGAGGLLWTNRPTGQGQLLGTLTAGAVGDVTFDVTGSALAKMASGRDAQLSLCLRSTVGGGNIYCAKEIGTDYAPHLTIE